MVYNSHTDWTNLSVIWWNQSLARVDPSLSDHALTLHLDVHKENEDEELKDVINAISQDGILYPLKMFPAR